MAVILTGRDIVTFMLRDITGGLSSTTPATLSFIGDYADELIGKNGNSIIYRKAGGVHCLLTLNVIQNSPEATWINTFEKTLESLGAYEPCFASIEQRLGDGRGNVKSKIYNLTGLFFKSQPIPAALMTLQGTEEHIVVYKLQGHLE